MAIVEADEIPSEAHLEVDDGPELMVRVGDKVVKQTNFLSFVISGKQYTSPSTAIQRLRRVKVDCADDTNNLVVRGVHMLDEFPILVDADELNAEMYHWGHQVYMVSYNDDAHPEYNVVIHVSRFCDDGHWHTLDYVAGVDIDPQFVKAKGLRNTPGVV
jgi:hypothetical protein